MLIHANSCKQSYRKQTNSIQRRRRRSIYKFHMSITLKSETICFQSSQIVFTAASTRQKLLNWCDVQSVKEKNRQFVVKSEEHKVFIANFSAVISCLNFLLCFKISILCVFFMFSWTSLRQKLCFSIICCYVGTSKCR